MILKTAAFLTALGFAAWILGTVFQYRGIAVIGGTIVVGVGAMVTGGSLEYRSGEHLDKTYTKTNNETVNNETVVDYRYSTVPLPQRLPLGVLWMLLGGLLTLHGINTG